MCGSWYLRPRRLRIRMMCVARFSRRGQNRKRLLPERRPGRAAGGRKPPLQTIPERAPEKKPANPSWTNRVEQTIRAAQASQLAADRLGLDAVHARLKRIGGSRRSRACVSKRRSRARAAGDEYGRLSLHLQHHERWSGGHDLSGCATR